MNLIKKHRIAIALFVIVVAAFFVRVYQFDDWLYFKMDQGRDANLIGNAIENGPMLLPLLGPRAGATQVDSGFLRLGPAYYYFQYISGKIFNSTEPQVFAYPDLFFSMGAIVLLYFFSRLYFSRKVSLAITTLYAFSFIIIEYSRFAWNPNSLQFFLLLTFFALLKFLNEEKMKAKLGWVALWALALAIGSQLHFFGFFVLLGVSGLFIVLRSKFWRKEKLQEFATTNFWKKMVMYSFTFAAVFTFFYTPVIISDVMRKGENASNFVQALTSKPSNKPLIEKISKNFSENTKYYCLISTSFCNVGSLSDNALPAIFTVILLVSGLVLAVRAVRKEQSAIKKDFLMLVFIWMGVFFILTTPVAFDLRPRFFILVFAIPFILTGIIFNFLLERFPKKSIYLVSAIFIAIFGSNIVGTSAWFAEQKNSQIDDVEVDRTLILKAKDGVTLRQLQKAVDFMCAKRKNKDATIYFYVKPEHVQPLRYIFEQKKDPTLKFATLNEKPNNDPNAQFFAIIPSQTDLASLEKKYNNNIESLSAEKVGQITVYEINFL
ncbi:MAG: phospholipid carrier-dependent glycosyltransferase, partial [Candidatus Moranbacteria bacterium]|nr:phospholipid carrier-dependent glycosyltransferase [Candidatus Moranbacteria bacterium]